MSRRGLFIVGGAILAVGLLVLGSLALFSTGSLREHLKKTYARAPTSEQATGSGARHAAVYISSKSPSAVVNDISSAWKPAERLHDPAGYFLRYRNDMVVVSPAEGGSGSRIFVDDISRGYARWYPYIGGYWGTYSAPGGGFRGGGPGSGK